MSRLKTLAVVGLSMLSILGSTSAHAHSTSPTTSTANSPAASTVSPADAPPHEWRCLRHCSPFEFEGETVTLVNRAANWEGPRIGSRVQPEAPLIPGSTLDVSVDYRLDAGVAGSAVMRFGLRYVEAGGVTRFLHFPSEDPLVGTVITASEWSTVSARIRIPENVTSIEINTISSGLNQTASSAGEGSFRFLARTTPESASTFVPPSDPSELTISRLAGADRYATAVRVSQEFASFERSAGSTVYVATGENFPDALVAAAAAGYKKAPLLLTGRASLPAAVTAEIARLEPEKVIIVGGVGAVSEAVEDQLARLLGSRNVTRIGGADRYSTARLIVEEAFEGRSGGLYLATGMNFPDALSAASAAGAAGLPVMITDGNASTLNPDALAVIQNSTVRNIFLVGGTGAISAGIEEEIKGIKDPNRIRRFAGADRFETSLLVNLDAPGIGAVAFLATGSTFPDALGGAALAASLGTALYTVPSGCIPAKTLADIRSKFTTITLLGGEGALSADVFALKACAG